MPYLGSCGFAGNLGLRLLGHVVGGAWFGVVGGDGGSVKVSRKTLRMDTGVCMYASLCMYVSSCMYVSLCLYAYMYVCMYVLCL